jgi:hypothetical protein
VNPFLILGIRKHVCPFETDSRQRSQAVAFPHVWTAGMPVEMDNRDGVLPFGFVI